MSTNDFTNEYKKKVDALQTLYRFKGNVETLSELNSKTDNNIGDTWNCEEDGNNYCWNKTEWVNIGTNIDLSNCATKTELALKADETELETKADKEQITELQTDIEQAIQDVADTVITNVATTTQDGLMSKEDKTRLDGISNATTTKDGLLSKEDKAKLDTLENIEVIQEAEFETGKIIDGKKEYRQTNKLRYCAQSKQFYKYTTRTKQRGFFYRLVWCCVYGRWIMARENWNPKSF